MKIELTTPALERMIGGDTEVEIAVRNQIAQAFTEKHLKALANTELMDAAKKEVRKHVNDIAENSLGISNLVTQSIWPSVRSDATYRMRELMRKLADEIAEAAFVEKLNERIEEIKRYLRGIIEKRINDALNAEIESKIREGIEKRLKAASEMSNGTQG